MDFYRKSKVTMTRIIFTFAFISIATLMQAQHTEKLEKLYYEGNYESVVNYLVDDELLSEEDYFIIANSFHKLGDFQTALYYYDLIDAAKHDLKDYFLNKAICEISVGDVDSAERHLFIYEDQVGKHPMVYYYFGVIDYEMLEYKSAALALEEAIELDENYLEAWYLLGAVMLEQEKYAKAVECFSEALKISPQHQRTRLYLAASLMYNKEYQKSLDLLEKLSLESPELKAEALYFQGEALYYLHDLDGACAKWTEAAEMGDEHAAKTQKNVCVKGKTEKHKPKAINRISL